MNDGLEGSNKGDRKFLISMESWGKKSLHEKKVSARNRNKGRRLESWGNCKMLQNTTRRTREPPNVYQPS